MPTKRVPIRPESRRQITQAALDSFRKMQRCAAACTCAGVRDWSRWWEKEDCAACDKWWFHHEQLHKELNLPLHQWPGIEDPRSPNPYPAGTISAKTWDAEIEKRRPAIDLFLQLSALLEQQQKAAAAHRESTPPPPLRVVSSA
jgi:hypothetical protein